MGGPGMGPGMRGPGMRSPAISGPGGRDGNGRSPGQNTSEPPPPPNERADREGSRPATIRNGNLDLDPLIGLEDSTKPLRSKLLAVPKYREKYLEIVARINQEILGSDFIDTRIRHYVPLIDELVKTDTRKLQSYDAFLQATNLEPAENYQGRSIPLKEFARLRHQFLNRYLENLDKQ